MPISQYPKFLALLFGLLILGGLFSAWDNWEAVKNAHWSAFVYVGLGIALGVFAIREISRRISELAD